MISGRSLARVRDQRQTRPEKFPQTAPRVREASPGAPVSASAGFNRYLSAFRSRSAARCRRERDFLRVSSIFTDGVEARLSDVTSPAHASQNNTLRKHTLQMYMRHNDR